MDKLSHFDFSFQKKLDKIIEANWHECFEKERPGPFSPLDHFFGSSYGILGGEKWVGLGGPCANHLDPPSFDLGIPYTPRTIDTDMPSRLGIKNLCNRPELMPIIFYIHENWHNTLKLIDEKISEVVALVYQKTDQNLAKINLLEETVNKQQNQLESLESKLEEQEKLIRQIINSKNDTIIDSYEHEEFIDDDPWCNLDE